MGYTQAEIAAATGTPLGTVTTRIHDALAYLLDANRLFYGDNLDVLEKNTASESVDLVYLDPPFNSNRSYNVIFKRHEVTSDDEAAQIEAFDDTWR